nr:MgtC/SapB family protein [uncultured Duganella sp.]
MLLTTSALTGMAVAAGCGLLIGIDRERRKGSGPSRAFAGMRSFALASFIGALAQVLGGALVLAASALVGALIVVAYGRDRSGDPGITTELALFLSFLLGVAAVDNPAAAAGAAVIVATVLHLRGPLHHFARVSLTRSELRDALLFAGAALVVRPLLPDAGSPWLLGVNPKTLWTLVILVMGIQAAAHVGLRLAGPRFGLAMSGFAAGFVSSVAAITAMGARCRKQPDLRAACVAGALLSNVATFVLLWVVAVTVAPAHLRQLAPILASGLGVALAVGALGVLRRRGAAAFTPASGRAFDIPQAALFAVLLTAATTALAYLNAHVGHGALLGGTALAGFFDMHAAAGSALSLLAGGAAAPRDAMLAVLLAVSTNMISKAIGALAGGVRYAVEVNASLALVLLACWLPFWLLAP